MHPLAGRDLARLGHTHRGADVSPNFNWNARGPVGGGMGYRVVADV